MSNNKNQKDRNRYFIFFYRAENEKHRGSGSIVITSKTLPNPNGVCKSVSEGIGGNYFAEKDISIVGFNEVNKADVENWK